MSKSWSSGNSYLRLVNSLQANPKKLMIYCTQSVQEQQLVLEAILQLREHISSGKELHVVIKRQSSHGGTIEVSVVDSKEMST